MILNYKLPNILPVFPLSDFIFFPNTSIPLNIFEQKYIEMINDSLKKDRLIGLIQPKYKKNYELDWKRLEKQNLDQVINSLCMIAPFSLEEKQILLESKKIIDRKVKLKEILNTYIIGDIENKTLQ